MSKLSSKGRKKPAIKPKLNLNSTSEDFVDNLEEICGKSHGITPSNTEKKSQALPSSNTVKKSQALLSSNKEDKNPALPPSISEKNNIVSSDVTANSRCPMCGKLFPADRTGAVRTSHLKSCGTKLGLTTDKLLAVRRLEERQAEERRALGLPSLPVESESHKSTTTSRVRQANKVESQEGGADPDLALALALSISAQDQPNINDNYKSQTDYILRDAKRNKSPIKTLTLPQPPQLKTLKRRGKRLVGQTCLQSRSESDRQRIIGEKVSSILYPEEEEELPLQRPSIGDSKSSNLSYFWSISSQIDQITYSTFISSILENFIDEGQTTESVEISAETVIDNPDDGNYSLVKPEPSFQLLSSDWLELLESGQRSDLRLLCKDEVEISAHLLVLQVRCPKLLVDLVTERDSESIIILSDYHAEVVRMVLRYLYGGVFDCGHITDRLKLAQLKKLSLKFGIKEISEFLKEVEIEQVEENIEEVITEEKLKKEEDVVSGTQCLGKLLDCLDSEPDNGDEELVEDVLNSSEDWDEVCHYMSQKVRSSVGGCESFKEHEEQAISDASSNQSNSANFNKENCPPQIVADISCELILRNETETSLIRRNPIETSLNSRNPIETSLISRNILETSLISRNPKNSSLIYRNPMETSLISRNPMETSLISKNTMETSLIQRYPLETSLIHRNLMETTKSSTSKDLEGSCSGLKSPFVESKLIENETITQSSSILNRMTESRSSSPDMFGQSDDEDMVNDPESGLDKDPELYVNNDPELVMVNDPELVIGDDPESDMENILEISQKRAETPLTSLKRKNPYLSPSPEKRQKKLRTASFDSFDFDSDSNELPSPEKYPALSPRRLSISFNKSIVRNSPQHPTDLLLDDDEVVDLTQSTPSEQHSPVLCQTSPPAQTETSSTSHHNSPSNQNVILDNNDFVPSTVNNYEETPLVGHHPLPLDPESDANFKYSEESVNIIYTLKLLTARLTEDNADTDKLEATLSALLDLEGVTVPDLLDTGVGKVVRKLRDQEDRVGRLAGKLVARWKKIVLDYAPPFVTEIKLSAKPVLVEKDLSIRKESTDNLPKEDQHDNSLLEHTGLEVYDHKSSKNYGNDSVNNGNDVDHDNVDNVECDVWNDFDEASAVGFDIVDNFQLAEESEMWRSENNFTEEEAPDVEKEIDANDDNQVRSETPIESVRNTYVNVVTPVTKLRNKSKDISVTPPPDYEFMLTPALRSELAKFGLKAVPRKKACLLLNHIYEQTHPLVPATPKLSPKLTMGRNKQIGRANNQKLLSPKGAIAKNKASPSAKGRKQNRINPVKKISTLDDDNLIAEKIQLLEDDDDLNISQSSQASTCSNSSNVSHMPEESILQDNLDDDLSQAVTNSATLHEQLTHFIRNRPSLQQATLVYEPIWLGVLVKDIKEAGIKCKVADVMDFLDLQCITFRTESNRNNKRTKKSPSKTKLKDPSQAKINFPAKRNSRKNLTNKQ